MFLYTNKSKKGLSLVTVLLFMLVATLAATGVFKWLSSQNKSSASRLMQSEVYQASQAGIETARSWISYNASDVGGLIKQYKDGNRKPILLDSVLYPLVSSKNQKFSVLLVGADTKSYPYKLKLISTGTARNGSKYSQVAILSVSGLYQVEVPENKKIIDFNFSFWGGSLEFGGGNTISSLALNGDWSGNPPLITGDFIVTGVLDLSGDNANVGGNTCVGKDLNTNNATGPLKDVYVHQDFLNAQGTYQNVYVNGNLTQSNKKIQINGSLNINGTLRTNLGAQEFEIMGDLVLGPTGVLNFDAENRPFTVHKNVWIPNSNGITGEGANYMHYLAKDLGAKLYAAGVTKTGDPGFWDPYYEYQSTSNTTFKSRSQNLGVSGDPLTGAESVKDYCNGIWSQEAGCDGSDFLIEDKLITAINSFETKAVTSSTCANLKTNFSDGDQMVNSLNDCYDYLDKNQPELLYNGFLVVRLTSNNLSDFSAILKGKFVFILEGPLGQQRLPAMSETSAVMLYLSQGSGQISPSTTQCNSTSFYNYFIYSLKEITEINAFNASCPINGTVYLPVKDPETGNLLCMGTTKTQGSAKLEFNPKLLEALSTASIICPNDGSTCGTPTGTPGSSSSSISSNGLDAYFIAVAPRLKTSLETQYVNKEIDIETLTSSSYDLLKPSILVMPRTIYLPTNAKGTLKQYFSVMNLNGANEDINLGSVSCPAGLNASGALTGSIPDVYTCTYSPGNSNYNSSHFFVVVDGLLEQGAKVSLSLSDASLVSFDPDFIAGESHEIFAQISGGSDKEVKFGLKITDPIPSGWTLTPVAPSGEITEIAPQVNVYYFTIKPSSGNRIIKLFDVVTNASATGAVVFELVTPFEGVEFVSKTVSLSLNGTATVVRKSLSEIPEEEKTDSIKKWIDYPACPDITTEWVRAIQNCSDVTVNYQWHCPITETNSIIELKESIPKFGCRMYQPDNNKIENPVEQDYTLYADYKRTPYTLNLKTAGTSSTVDVIIKDSLDGVSEQHISISAGETKSIEVFHGVTYEITVTPPTDYYARWICEGASCSRSDLPNPATITPSADNNILTAIFPNTNPCFTENFKGLQEDCPATNGRCIDECKTGNNCSVNGGYYPGEAAWTMVYANKNGDFEKLDIVDNEGEVSYAGYSKYPAFILKPVAAGYNGTYTTQIRTYRKNNISSNHSMNTGLVFRSNADGTSYFSLSILAVKQGVKGTDLIRVCYGTDAHIGSEDHCMRDGDAVGVWSGSSIDDIQTYTVTAILEGDKLRVFVVDEDGSIYIPETEFDLTNPKFGAVGVSETENEYIGFKLYGEHARYYSLSWKSSTYNCWDPELHCSFKANYAGGRVPANTNVTPWAFVSNYCDIGTECCTYNYIPTAPMQFEQGIYSDSTVMVWASCERDGYNNVFDTISCGSFFVGNRMSCTEDISINSSLYCGDYTNCEYPLTETSNFRDASLEFDLTLNSGIDVIRVYLLDDKGIKSQAYLAQPGVNKFSVVDYIDVDMFNPEQISKVLFQSENGLSFDVNSLRSICSNSLQLSDCDVSYSGSSLTIKANVANAGSCNISAPGFSETGISCDGSWEHLLKDVDLSSYAGQTLSWDLTANSILDPSITKTCSDTVTIKAPSGSCSWSPTTLTATTTGKAEFTVNFSDCPTLGCTYEIKNHKYESVATGKGTTGTASFETPADAGTYTYKAFVNDNEVCGATLTVKAGTPPTASCSGVSSSGEFTASVTDNDLVGWAYQVVVTDNIGNTLHTSDPSATTTGSGSISYTGYSPSVSGTYQYTLIFNGNSVCSKTLTITGSITSCTLSPTTINASDNVTFTANTNKIANGTSCEIKDASGGSPSGLASNIVINNNECSSTFNPTQTGTYTVYIGGYNRSCGTVTVNVSSSSVVASSSSVGTTITLTYDGAGYDFAPGTYNIGCTNGQIVCGAAGVGKTLSNSNGGGCSSLDWWTLSNMTTGCGSCPGATITVTGGTMRCKNSW